MLQNARQALRQGLTSWRMYGALICSVALATGATTSVFNTADWLLNRPPAGIAEPDRLVALKMVESQHPEVGSLGLSLAQIDDLRAAQDSFQAIAAYAKVPGLVSAGAAADEAVIEFVSGNYFSVLQTRADVGRILEVQDDTPAAPVPVLISHQLWQSALARDPNVLARTISVNGQVCRVIGVMPSQFDDYDLDWNGATGVWAPLQGAPALGNRGLVNPQVPLLVALGRLRPNVSFSEAQGHAASWVNSIRPASIGSFRGTGLALEPGNERRIGRRQQARGFLDTLLVVCGLTLLAACLNMAMFLLARTLSRAEECRTRVALGATPGQIFWQFFTEAILLGLCAALLGLLAAVGFSHALADLPKTYLGLPASAQSFSTTNSIGGRLIVLTLAVGMVVTVAFGTFPAVVAARGRNLKPVRLRRQGRLGTRGFSLREGLLALQVALALSLAVPAGLFVRSVIRVANLDSGFRSPASVLVARVTPVGMKAPEGHVFYQALLGQLRVAPHVESVSIGSNAPFTMGLVAIKRPDTAESAGQIASNTAGAGFWSAQGVPVVAGRDLIDSLDDEQHAVTINTVLARRLWPGQDPIGQTVLWADERRTVVGVVDFDRCADLLMPPQPCVWRGYSPAAGFNYLRIKLSAVSPESFAAQLQAMVHQLNPAAAVTQAQSLETLVAGISARQRVAALLSAGLALFGVGLLVFGTASMFLAMVRENERELAIRTAVGAGPTQLSWSVAAVALRLVVAGTVVGYIGARIVATRLEAEFYQTRSTDVATYLLAGFVVALAAIAPVYRAARVAVSFEPASTLKSV